MTDARRFGGLRAAGGLLHGLALVPGWLTVKPKSDAAQRYERRFMERVARGLVRDILLAGVHEAAPGTLFVSNHISWLDIPVLGSALDTAFIAKADVKGWPLIGPLSRRSGTLFVKREERHRVRDQASSIEQRLRAGHSLLLFPEGTTSDGTGILPFRSSLFEAAQHASRVQPLAIGYHAGDGRRLDDGELRRIGWTGEEPLLPNLARVSGLNIRAEVRLMPAFAPEPGMSRKALAERCRSAVAEAYRQIRGR